MSLIQKFLSHNAIVKRFIIITAVVLILMGIIITASIAKIGQKKTYHATFVKEVLNGHLS